MERRLLETGLWCPESHSAWAPPRLLSVCGSLNSEDGGCGEPWRCSAGLGRAAAARLPAHAAWGGSSLAPVQTDGSCSDELAL